MFVTVCSAWADIALMTLDRSAIIAGLWPTAQTTPYTGRTAWARNLATPVRDFLSTETGGAIVLLAAAIVALMWANGAVV